MVYIKEGEKYPEYLFEEVDPLPFIEVVKSHNGLPLNSRNTEEVISDIETGIRFSDSQVASLERRQPKRYESKFVVEYLDELDRQFSKVGKFAIESFRQAIVMRAAKL